MMFPIFLVLLLIVIYLINAVRKPKGYPPGPQWLPIVGNLPQLKKLSRKLGGQHLALHYLAKKFQTNVLGLKLGPEHVVVVFSHPVVRKILSSEEYEGRPDNFFLRLRCNGTKRGITSTDGELWTVQRKFVVRHLKNLGFGKQPMEVIIREQIPELLKILKENGPDGRIGSKILAPLVLNVLWTLTSGRRISIQHPQLGELLDLFATRSKVFDMSGGVLNQFPWLRFVAPEKVGFNLITRINDDLDKFLMTTIEEHYQTWHEGRNDDLIYSYISEIKQANGHQTTFTNKNLVMNCLDLFIGGAETTSNTLDFAILCMILYPEVQKKIHAEIDGVLLEDSIELSDRMNLPYLEAVLLEVERFYHVVPISGPRRVLQDTTLEGYSIPKDTTILISLYSVHNDKEYWKDPESFRPERFLDEKGSVRVRENLIPFGLGKRRCLGDVLAKSCIFLFFAEILRKFEISLMPGYDLPTGKPLPGITLSPEFYRARFKDRK